MRIQDRMRSLRVFATLWIILPLSLVMLGLIAGGWFVFQRTTETLVLERYQQLAGLAAVSVSDEIHGMINILEALASNASIGSESADIREAALKAASIGLEDFDAGVMIVSEEGSVLTTLPSDVYPIGRDASEQQVFLSVRDELKPSLSGVLSNQANGEKIILVAVPVFDDENRFSGTVIGAVHLHTASFAKLMEKLIIGQNGLAYLVDRQGKVILHPDPSEIGADYRDRPFISRAVAGEGGGMVWEAPSGERLVVAGAAIPAAGWGIIVQEDWTSAVAQAQYYSAIAALGSAGLLLVLGALLWYGAQRIVTPIHLLSEKTLQLARGNPVQTSRNSGILEIDHLGRSFTQMADQITAYRAGLRRYIQALTQSQEEERRRIARDLHDETVQNLLAIARRLELFQASETDPEHQAHLEELRSMVSDTLIGVRQIGRDLRPLMLEDLGLVPALQTLVGAARQQEGSLMIAELSTVGEIPILNPYQELILYRITQEALSNIRKHAEATQAKVIIRFDPDSIQLEVSDNGTGFCLPDSLTEFTQRGSFGLMGIQERVWSAGGELSIQTAPGQGTRLFIQFPILNQTISNYPTPN